MSRALLIAELATAHGGDLSVAEDLIRAAADCGATYAKFQSYSLSKLNRSDPQAAWLTQAHLDKAAHERLLACCQRAGIEFLSTPFDSESLQLLRELGLKTFKIASSEAHRDWWMQDRHERWFVSWPWGRTTVPEHHVAVAPGTTLNLTAIPLYPTPLECVGQATLLDGWSDHCEGISACQWALARGAQVIEYHLCLPGRSRQMKWDKTPEQALAIRKFAEDVCTMTTGVAQQFRDRWTA